MVEIDSVANMDVCTKMFIVLRDNALDMPSIAYESECGDGNLRM